MKLSIESIQKQYGFKWQPDYKRFLNHCKDYKINNKDLRYVTPKLEDYVKTLSPAPIKEALEEKADSYLFGFYQDFGTLYEAKEQIKMYQQAQKHDDDLHFWSANGSKHAYLVGTASNGDPIVQVSNGKYAGKIYRGNHEGYGQYWDYFLQGTSESLQKFREIDQSHIYGDEKPMYADVDLENLTTDQVIEIMEADEADQLSWIADSFDEFLVTYISNSKLGPTDDELTEEWDEWAEKMVDSMNEESIFIVPESLSTFKTPELVFELAGLQKSSESITYYGGVNEPFHGLALTMNTPKEQLEDRFLAYKTAITNYTKIHPSSELLPSKIKITLWNPFSSKVKAFKKLKKKYRTAKYLTVIKCIWVIENKVLFVYLDDGQLKNTETNSIMLSAARLEEYHTILTAYNEINS